MKLPRFGISILLPPADERHYTGYCRGLPPEPEAPLLECRSCHRPVRERWAGQCGLCWMDRAAERAVAAEQADAEVARLRAILERHLDRCEGRG